MISSLILCNNDTLALNGADPQLSLSIPIFDNSANEGVSALTSRLMGREISFLIFFNNLPIISQTAGITEKMEDVMGW